MRKTTPWYKCKCKECNAFEYPDICHNGEDGMRRQHPDGNACKCFEKKLIQKNINNVNGEVYEHRQ